jgi:hypothetical protein
MDSGTGIGVTIRRHWERTAVVSTGLRFVSFSGMSGTQACADVYTR